MAGEKDDHDSPANPDNQISLERQAADREHEAKLAGDLPPRPAPDHPVAPERARHQRRAPGGAGVARQETPSTGHSWDGITEYDNPMPRWWLWTFYVTIVWAIGYMIAYPALPLFTGSTQGLLGWTARKEVAVEIERFNEQNAAIQQELASVDLTSIPTNPELLAYATNAGGAVFRTWCAQCHGSGASGAPGYPSLIDDSWLWGGSLEDIHLTVQHGIRDPQDGDTRYSEMPRFGVDEMLSNQEIDEVANYVLALSNSEHDATLAAAGEQIFVDNCSSCHMEDGSGDRMQGAPALNDQIWLYGGDFATIRRITHDGPFGVMPAWNARLSEADIRAVATYVHSLGGGE